MSENIYLSTSHWRVFLCRHKNENACKRTEQSTNGKIQTFWNVFRCFVSYLCCPSRSHAFWYLLPTFSSVTRTRKASLRSTGKCFFKYQYYRYCNVKHLSVDSNISDIITFVNMCKYLQYFEIVILCNENLDIVEYLPKTITSLCLCTTFCFRLDIEIEALMSAINKLPKLRCTATKDKLFVR